MVASNIENKITEQPKYTDEELISLFNDEKPIKSKAQIFETFYQILNKNTTF
jgi:hypothetical protein